MRKPRRMSVVLDMTPMVDIAFLLLIFFMTTTSFKPPEEVSVELPSSNAEYKIPESNVLILTVTRDSNLYVQRDPVGVTEKVSLDNLGLWVRSERTRNPRVRMIVKADKRCDYGTMEDVMKILVDQRANRFVLMTEGEGAVAGEKALDEEGEETPGAGEAGLGPGAETDRALAQLDRSANRGRN